MIDKTKIPLRDYQREFCAAVWRAFFLGDDEHEKVRMAVAVMATGGGKTRCFAAIAERFISLLEQRVLVLADTDELVDQAITSLATVTGIVASIEKAAKTASLAQKLVVGCVDSVARPSRLERFPRDHFGLVIADECHLAISPKWRRVFDYFRSAKILGVTATPDRGDRRSIMTVFEREVCNISLPHLIEHKWLCPITVKQIPLEIDLSEVNMTRRDLDPEELDSALEPFFDAIATAIKEHAWDRKILCFAPLRKTSEAFVRACCRHGIAARHVDGDSDDRRETLQGFRERRFQLLSNAMLLTKGYDDPGIDCIIVLRLTKSRSLYQQMIGRGTRLHDGKQDLLVLDFLWKFGDMMGKRDNRPIGIVDMMAETDEIAEALAKKLASGQQLDLMLATDEARRQREERLMEEIRRQASRRRRVKTFDYVTYCATVGARQLADYEPMGSQERGTVTQRQAALLQRIGVDPDAIETRGHASAIIGDWIGRMNKGLANAKQLGFLHRLGVKEPAPDLTFEDAKRLISDRLHGVAR